MNGNSKLITYGGSDIMIPDDVMIRDGAACGDTIHLIGAVNDGIFSFCMKGDCCRICGRSMDNLSEKFNNRPVPDVLSELSEINRRISDDQSYIPMDDVPEGRRECATAPFELLYGFLKRLSEDKIEVYDTADTKAALDCDACVSTSRIAWNNEVTRKVDNEPFEEYPESVRKIWMSGAKAVISDEERQAMADAFGTVDEKLLDFMEHKKIDQMVYYNLLNSTDIDVGRDSRFKSIFYRYYRMKIVSGEIQKLREYIASEGIQAYFIKGSRNLDLYEGRGIRLFLDYDILCSSFSDAFRLGSYLFSSGFSIFPGVFSLKESYADGKPVLCGHFHVQKMLLERFKVIIDISCPAFPMGRIGLFYPEVENGLIRAEDNLIVSVCHTFKHRDVFMKDINDVYLAMRCRELDLNYLYKRIRGNSLELFCSVLFGFIFENYDLDKGYIAEFKKKVPLDYSVTGYEGWPYSRSAVYNVKHDDLETRLETGDDNPRTYLFPIAAFSREYGNIGGAVKLLTEDGFDVRKMDAALLYVQRGGVSCYLTPMGVFIDSQTNGVEVGRTRVQEQINRLLDVISAPQSLLIPFAIRNNDDWF